jgi:hypothetical protein
MLSSQLILLSSEAPGSPPMTCVSWLPCRAFGFGTDETFHPDQLALLAHLVHCTRYLGESILDSTVPVST